MVPKVTDYLLSWFGLLDLVTILPAIIVYGMSQSAAGRSSVQDSAAFAFMRLLRVLRIYRLRAVFPLMRTELSREAVKLVLTLVSSVFIWAGIAQVCGTVLPATTGVWCGFKFAGDACQHIPFC